MSNEKLTSRKRKAEAYDHFGNSHEMWFETAMDLLTASSEIKLQCRVTMLKLGIPFTRSYFPRLMLRAFATECLLKCHFLNSKMGKICIDGELSAQIKKIGHNYVKLSDAAGFPTDDAEKHMLDRLSAIAIGIGRYPERKFVQPLMCIVIPPANYCILANARRC